jgi:hypothetical protein
VAPSVVNGTDAVPRVWTLVSFVSYRAGFRRLTAVARRSMRSEARRWATPVAALVLLGTLALPSMTSAAPTPPSRVRLGAPRIAYGPPSSAALGMAPTVHGASSLRRSTLGSGRQTWTAASLPSSTFGFEAIPRIGSNWPGDPTGAVGDDWYFTAVNTSYALYDRSGTTAIGPDPLIGLFSLPNRTQVFDPKVVYDPYGHTFVMAFLAVNDALERSWILVVTIPNATASDPTTWCGSQIDSDRTKGDGAQWADYPGLGFDGDRITITSNQFDFSGSRFRSVQILSFAKSRLYDCTEQVRFATFTANDTLNPDGTLAFTIQPATTAGGTNPSAQYLLSFEDGTPNFVVVWKVKRTTKGVKLTRAAVKVAPAPIAPYGTQGNGSLRKANTWWDPGDLRFVNAFYDARLNRVYAAHVVADDLKRDSTTGGYLESAVRWYEVRPAANLKSSDVTRAGIIGTPETDAGWPVLATDAAGDLFVTYSRASQPRGEFLSAWVAEVVPGHTAATLLELDPGEARMEAVKGVERWGDYNAISRDPVTGSFMAIVNQYAKSDGAGITADWQQTVDIVNDAA